MTEEHQRWQLLKNLRLFVLALNSDKGYPGDPTPYAEQQERRRRHVEEAKCSCRDAGISEKLIDSTVSEAKKDAYVESLDFHGDT